MIVISLLFFLLGVGLLAAGLVIESIQLELGAVVAALVSALALYAGVRQRQPADEEEAAEPAEPWKAPPLTAPRRGREADEVWSPPPPDEPWPTGPVDSAKATDDTATPIVQEPTWGSNSAHSAALDESAEAEPAEAEPAEAEPVVTDVAAEIPALDDEPAEEEVSPANVARVAARSDDVLVVDGRPRYHRRACSSLIGRESVPLPVSEAREAGFTPCARCRPDAHLLGSLERPQRR